MELPALGMPLEHGGTGADHVTQAIMVEELSRACASTSLMMLISKLGMIPVMNWGYEDRKQRYLSRIASGEIQASYCLSEPDAGSDVASMKTRAVRDGDDYVLNGASTGSPTPASPTSTPCSPRPIRAPVTEGSPPSWSRSSGASRSASWRRRWACGAARPARSSSRTCEFPRPT